MSQSSEKQFMYGKEYRDALDNYVEGLPYDVIEDMLKDYIFEYMEDHLTNDEIQHFIDYGEF